MRRALSLSCSLRAGTVVSVGGDPNWSHDNWDWVFRKCPAGATPSSCAPQ